MITRASSAIRILVANKVRLLVTTILLGSGAHAAFSPEKGFGAGFLIGSPAGVSASLPVGERNAFNFLLGYDLTRNANLYLHGDYVWYRHDIFPPVEKGAVSLYYGPGVAAIASGDPAMGVRAVVGVDYRFPDAPLQLFFEIAPGINVLPRTDVNGSGGLGLRYYF